MISNQHRYISLVLNIVGLESALDTIMYHLSYVSNQELLLRAIISSSFASNACLVMFSCARILAELGPQFLSVSQASEGVGEEGLHVVLLTVIF